MKLFQEFVYLLKYTNDKPITLETVLILIIFENFNVFIKQQGRFLAVSNDLRNQGKFKNT